MARVKKGRLHLQVVDQGLGMNSEQLNRICEKFYRVDNADTSIRGPGLGMSIVREIVAAHGGEIRVESTPQQGTRVSLSIPLD